MKVCTHDDFIVLPPLGDQATMTIYPTQSHYLESETIRCCHILIMLTVWLGSDRHRFLNHCVELKRVQTRQFKSHDLLLRDAVTQLIRPSVGMGMCAGMYVLGCVWVWF